MKLGRSLNPIFLDQATKPVVFDSWSSSPCNARASSTVRSAHVTCCVRGKANGAIEQRQRRLDPLYAPTISLLTPRRGAFSTFVVEQLETRHLPLRFRREAE